MSEVPPVTPPKQSSVLRNTLILVGVQVVGIPLTIVLHAIMGRQLGPSDFGLLNMAISLCGFGFLFVDWGHSGILPREIAKDRSRSGVLLGTSLASRIGLGVIVTLSLGLLSAVLYPLSFLPLLALIALQGLIGSLSAAYQDAARGLERTEVTAMGRIGALVFNAAIILPVLYLGGGLMSLAIAGTVGAFLILPLVATTTHRVGVGKPSFDRRELSYLTRNGWAFMVSAAAMTALGFVDTIALSKLATPEVFGWNSAAQKLVGTLLIPASALIAALYPTLSRLFVENRGGFDETLRRSINGTGLLAIPLALGCALYSDLGVAVYGKEGYAPAGQNLVVLSGLVLLVYFSMPLSSALLATGRHVSWATAQFGCVILRVVLNLLLIPWFQVHYGNGGLGVCVASVVCEIVLVAVALALIPRGVVNRELLKVLGKGVVAGLAMSAAALALRGINAWLAAPVAMAVYFGTLYLVGGIDEKQARRLIDGIRSKVPAFR